MHVRSKKEKLRMVSRIETVGNSPALRNFVKYVDGLGLEIKLENKVK